MPPGAIFDPLKLLLYVIAAAFVIALRANEPHTAFALATWGFTRLGHWRDWNYSIAMLTGEGVTFANDAAVTDLTKITRCLATNGAHQLPHSEITSEWHSGSV